MRLIVEVNGMHYLRGENMGDVRKNNRTRFLEIMFKYGPVSRSEISEISGLTPPTVTALANELLSEGLVEEFGIDTGNRALGRKRIQLSLVKNSRLVIGVEIGVKQILAGLVNLSGEMLIKRSVMITFKEPDTVIRQTIDLIRDIVKECQDKKVIGIGIGATGLVDSDAGVVRNSPNLEWRNIQLRELLEREIAIPVVVDNNVRLMALGENTFLNHWSEVSGLILIHAGYGIGCGIILNGQLYCGNSFSAGEFGHTVIMPNGILCSCGKHGCLETLASGRAMTSAYRQKKSLEDLEYSKIMEKLLKNAENGEQGAVDILSEAGTYMGYGINNLISLFAPDSIILHGSLFHSEIYTTPVMKLIQENHYGNSERITIKQSQVDDELVILGAGALALQRFLICKIVTG
ncbi:MAG TPA: hypothetical protein DDW50_06795 [Firmicutes bacterium]|nr:hypothetical protein [Bacillota bacterium]